MLKIETWPLAKIIPDENHLRKNNHAVGKVAEAIATFGFRVPLLVRSPGELVDGDLRYKAAKLLKFTEVPVILVDDLSDAQIRAFKISVNRMADLAEWDEELLAAELQRLMDDGFPVELTGFDMDEVDKLLAGLVDNEKDPDLAPPPPANPVTERGDLWIIGDHLLLCGDSTSSEDFTLLMACETADLVWTDPPYNVDYKGKAGKILNDKMKSSEFSAFMCQVFSCLAAIMAPGAPIYVAHADTERLNVQGAMNTAGLKVASCLIWRKNQMVLGRADYHWQHEPILYGWKPGSRHSWHGGRTRRTVFELDGDPQAMRISDTQIQVKVGDEFLLVSGENLSVDRYCSTIACEDKPLRNEDHPTMKPVALIERFLANSSRPGNVVVDAFGGSGSTLIACEIRKRKARLMELDPRFCDVIVRRWQEYTGGIATLAGTDASFNQVKELRGKVDD
jgi:DNA modification methylase